MRPALCIENALDWKEKIHFRTGFAVKVTLSNLSKQFYIESDLKQLPFSVLKPVFTSTETLVVLLDCVLNTQVALTVTKKIVAQLGFQYSKSHICYLFPFGQIIFSEPNFPAL